MFGGFDLSQMYMYDMSMYSNEYTSPEMMLQQPLFYAPMSDPIPTTPTKEDLDFNFSAPACDEKPEVTLGYPLVITEGVYCPRVKPTILKSAKPLRCSTCHQPFERGSSLRRHEKLHTGVKPFKCSPCNKSFTRLDILRRHQSSTRCRLTSSKLQN
ncbi:hypothetical protein DSO57_1019616 [Entomophthora muscae]|uniref:Uncharacterized protein n=1 Tax=Entomophthora muscae TaxID=34485 RepID=A0ACC2U1R9_9FUNG|nr:hypothetical protein DSO57_1019616 [Entomophthora muscae]